MYLYNHPSAQMPSVLALFSGLAKSAISEAIPPANHSASSFTACSQSRWVNEGCGRGADKKILSLPFAQHQCSANDPLKCEGIIILQVTRMGDRRKWHSLCSTNIMLTPWSTKGEMDDGGRSVISKCRNSRCISGNLNTSNLVLYLMCLFSESTDPEGASLCQGEQLWLHFVRSIPFQHRETMFFSLQNMKAHERTINNENPAGLL